MWCGSFAQTLLHYYGSISWFHSAFACFLRGAFYIRSRRRKFRSRIRYLLSLAVTFSSEHPYIRTRSIRNRHLQRRVDVNLPTGIADGAPKYLTTTSPLLPMPQNFTLSPYNTPFGCNRKFMGSPKKISSNEIAKVIRKDSLTVVRTHR